MKPQSAGHVCCRDMHHILPLNLIPLPHWATQCSHPGRSPGWKTDGHPLKAHLHFCFQFTNCVKCDIVHSTTGIISSTQRFRKHWAIVTTVWRTASKQASKLWKQHTEAHQSRAQGKNSQSFSGHDLICLTPFVNLLFMTPQYSRIPGSELRTGFISFSCVVTSHDLLLSTVAGTIEPCQWPSD